jgi:hypothetical protein
VSPAVTATAGDVTAVSLWSERLVLTALVVAAVIGALALMRLGWVRRGRRQTDIARSPDAPPLPPPGAPTDVTEVDARYLGANRVGDWLDRIVVHGLGVPSRASVSVRAGGTAAGVWLARVGAPDIYLPADEVAGARHDRAGAGRATETAAMLVLQWNREPAPIELALRVRDAEQAQLLQSAVEALTATTASGGPR